MPTQTAEGIDEAIALRVVQRKSTYDEFLEGKREETALAYVVPQKGITIAEAFAIEQRVAVYEQFTQQIKGIGRKLHIGVVREDVNEGCRGFNASTHEKYATLKPGERITFKINAASDLEKAALSEIKTILENAAKGNYSFL